MGEPPFHPSADPRVTSSILRTRTRRPRRSDPVSLACGGLREAHLRSAGALEATGGPCPVQGADHGPGTGDRPTAAPRSSGSGPSRRDDEPLRNQSGNDGHSKW